MTKWRNPMGDQEEKMAALNRKRQAQHGKNYGTIEEAQIDKDIARRKFKKRRR